ncbi:MAG: TolC family protein, partial [Burkholderiaceae bacterium]
MHMPPLLPVLPSDQVIQPLQQRPRPVRALLLASLAFAAHSQVMALSLQQAAELALNNDPQYLAAQKATQGSEEALNQARGGRLPFVSAAASSGKSEIEAMTGAGSTTDLKPRSYRLSI